MGTREEITGERCLDFSRWIRKHLPNSRTTGMRAYNLDWIFWDRARRHLTIAEEKTHGGDLRPQFRECMKTIIAPALADYCARNNIQFHGFREIIFENTDPTNGRILLDNVLVTPLQLATSLSFNHPNLPPI